MDARKMFLFTNDKSTNMFNGTGEVVAQEIDQPTGKTTSIKNKYT